MRVKSSARLYSSVNNYVMTIRMELNKRVVEIYKGPNGDWSKDKVYIYDPQLQVSEDKHAQIMDYLFSEGFIEDRRTQSELVRIKC